MSRKGNLWDNGPTESFFNSLKNERVHGARYTTRKEAIKNLFEYIKVFYNRSHRYSTLESKSPVRFLQNWICAARAEHGSLITAPWNMENRGNSKCTARWCFE